jgi:hypothetical protein
MLSGILSVSAMLALSLIQWIHKIPNKEWEAMPGKLQTFLTDAYFVA